MMRILITGDRHWVGQSLVNMVLDGLYERSGHELLVIHGMAKGADTCAHNWCEKGVTEGKKIFENACPADWERYGRAAGPKRNTFMLSHKPQLVIAFHNDLENSKGTKNMVKQSRRASIPVVHVRELP